MVSPRIDGFQETPMLATSLRALLLPIAALGLLGGCQAPGPHDAAPLASSAQVNTISPDAAQPLRPGEHVQLRVNVGYAVAAPSGTLTLIVLSADNSSLARDVKAVEQGRGTAALQADFTVPDTQVVRVYTALVVKGEESTSAVDGRAYEVVPR
jgi:hypothetical protein